MRRALFLHLLSKTAMDTSVPVWLLLRNRIGWSSENKQLWRKKYVWLIFVVFLFKECFFFFNFQWNAFPFLLTCTNLWTTHIRGVHWITLELIWFDSKNIISLLIVCITKMLKVNMPKPLRLLSTPELYYFKFTLNLLLKPGLVASS